MSYHITQIKCFKETVSCLRWPFIQSLLLKNFSMLGLTYGAAGKITAYGTSTVVLCH